MSLGNLGTSLFQETRSLSVTWSRRLFYTMFMDQATLDCMNMRRHPHSGHAAEPFLLSGPAPICMHAQKSFPLAKHAHKKVYIELELP